MLFDVITDVFIDTAIDTIKILPFLFLAYLLMEYIEEAAGRGSNLVLEKSRFLGPFWGALAGVIPQCGFSASASGLYSGGVISLGTLLAIFLSTSDEMLPIFISEKVAFGTIIRILALKCLLGMISGFLIDALIRRHRKKHTHLKHIHDLCEHDHCHCESEGGILVPAIRHTLQIAAYIFLVSLVLNGLIAWIGEDSLAGFLHSIPVLGVFLSGIVGLLPNCAASVVLTEMYIGGLITASQMMAGLLVGAGVGILVLFRTNKDMLENVKITLLLYLTGVFWGLLIQFSGISF